MARKKKQPEHENHERWLVSYADFITLLFAFFVVMFASSQADQGKAEQVSESVREALEEGGFTTLVASVLGGTTGDKGQGNAQRKGPGGAEVALREGEEQGLGAGDGGTLVELKPALEFLSDTLSEQIEAGQMEVSLEARGLVVSFREVMLFPSGEATLTGDNMDAIAKVARVIRELPNPVRMEGHTDAVPIHNAKFASNWELSSARAITMLEMFNEQYRIPREKMSIAAYADNAPVSTNDTADGRARNRRVDIILLSEIGVQAEPPSASGHGGAADVGDPEEQGDAAEEHGEAAPGDDH